MRKLKYINCFKVVILLSILIIISASCKKDDEVSSSYYGKWTTVKAVPSSGGFIERKYDLTLSKMNKYNESFFIETGGMFKNSEYVSIDGTFIILENHMQFNAEKISISKYYSANNYVDSPYSIITDSLDIDNMLSGFIKVTSGHKAEFSLNGNKLTLSVDYDENGNYLDYDEILIYTRQ